MTAKKQRTLAEAAEAAILGLPDEDEATSGSETEAQAEATEATPATPTEGEQQKPTEPAAAEPKAPEKQAAPDSQESPPVDWEKRFKDTQAAYTKQAQELAEIKKQLSAHTPPLDVTAAEKVLQPTEHEGVAAIRQLFEKHPDLVDDPVKNAQFNSQKAADIARIVVRQELEQQKAEIELDRYAQEAAELFGDIDLSALRDDARQAYIIHKNLGTPGNPYITALAAKRQDALKSRLAGQQKAKTNAAEQEAAAKASVRMERPGPVVANTAKADVKVTDDEYLSMLVDQLPSFRKPS